MWGLAVVASLVATANAATVTGVDLYDMNEPLDAPPLCVGLQDFDDILVPASVDVANVTFVIAYEGDVVSPDQPGYFLVDGSGDAGAVYNSFKRELYPPFVFSGDQAGKILPYNHNAFAPPDLIFGAYNISVRIEEDPTDVDWDLSFGVNIVPSDRVATVTCVNPTAAPTSDSPTAAPTQLPTPSPTVFDIRVVGFVLVDAATDTDVAILEEGPVAFPADFDPSLSNVRVVTSGAGVRSVVVELDDAAVVVDNVAPYSVFGDDHGDYAAHGLEVDRVYTLTATPYGDADGLGVAGTPLMIDFYLWEETAEPSAMPTAIPTPLPSALPSAVPTAPSPAPSPAPSRPPTPWPTPQPTHSPTPQPTHAPTHSPTPQPTEEPTRWPTRWPTKHPTAQPTQQPTKWPTRWPTQQPTKWPTKWPTQQPTKWPTKWPTKQPTGFIAPPGNVVEEIFLVEDNNLDKLTLDMGHHHLIWRDGAAKEQEVWFHGLEEYNIGTKVGAGVATLELTGYYYRYRNVDNQFLAEIDYSEKLWLHKKTYENVQPNSEWYPFLNGWEQRSSNPTTVPSWRWERGKIFLEAGEFHLKATPLDAAGNKGTEVFVTVQVRANPQRSPIFDEGLALQPYLWKDVMAWQNSLRSNNPGSADLVSNRQGWGSPRISQVTFFKSHVYIVHETWGTVFRCQRWDRTSTTSGLELFLDVAKGMEQYGPSTLGLGNSKHSGLRSVALHPWGSSDDGRIYVSAMEEALPEWQKSQYTYMERDPTWNPVDEESVLVEFKYAGGKGQPWTYRSLLRVECPVLDHTIRQIAFGPDNYLYLLHGDGSIESSIVGEPQRDDGLGKVHRLDPLDGKGLSASLAQGQYSTAGNPFEFSDEPSRPRPATPPPLDVENPVWGPVPRETYALGFRNPHTLTFANDGTLVVGEAGRDTFEEVNVIVSGGNYGWSYFEGTYYHTKLQDTQTNAMFYSSQPARWNDECPKCGFRLPAVALGHAGYEGMQFNMVAMAGGHVVENGSPVANHGRGPKYFYADFPRTGTFHYSYLSDIKATANTATGRIHQHRTATMFYARFRDTNGKWYATFRDYMKSVNAAFNDEGKGLDLRIGRDDTGAMYISTKSTGQVFKILNSQT